MQIVNSLSGGMLQLLCLWSFRVGTKAALAIPLFDATWRRSLSQSLSVEDLLDLNEKWARCIAQRVERVCSARTCAERVLEAERLRELTTCYGAARLDRVTGDLIDAARRGGGRCELELLRVVSRQSLAAIAGRADLLRTSMTS